MYYYNINEKGTWKVFKLSADEVKKVRQLTVVECIKTLKQIKAIAEKAQAELGFSPSPEQQLEIFNRTAPDYGSLAVDYLRNKSAKAAATNGSSTPANQ